jgi:hypothetical protein
MLTTVIRQGFSNIPRSLTLAVQPSKRSHQLQKIRQRTISEDYPGGVDRIATAALISRTNSRLGDGSR